MKIGSGTWTMQFPEGFFPAEGFVVQAHPLHIRALVLGEKEPAVLVSLEMTSLPDSEVEALRAVAADCAGTQTGHVWITVTHTFAAPHIMPDPMMKTDADRMHREILRSMLREGVQAAVHAAMDACEETETVLHQGVSTVLASRDIELPEGWWVGCGGTGDSDRTLTVLEFRAGDALRAVALHLNVQSSVLDGSGAEAGRAVSGDLAGCACADLEKELGVPVLFFIGAAADQAPVERAAGYVPDGNGSWKQTDLKSAGIPVAERLGSTLAEETLSVLRMPGYRLEGGIRMQSMTVTVPAKKMNRNLHELHPTHSCTWEPDGSSEQPVACLIWDRLAVIGVKPELTCKTLRSLQAESSYPVTLVATLVNGGAKYMADQSAYDHCMYEAINSPFAPGAAEILVRSVYPLLRKPE